MMTDVAAANRRQFERYSLMDSVYLAFRPRFDRLGLLKDISLGGVAFEYTVCDEPETFDSTSIEVEVFSHETFRLSRIPCKIVYDTKVEASSWLLGLETRRCGLQFEKLSDSQESQLKVLMDAHVGRPVPKF